MTEIRFEATDKGSKLDFGGYKGRKCITDAEEFMRLMREFGVNLDTDTVQEKPEIHEVGEGERIGTRR